MPLGGLQNEADLDRYLADYLGQFGNVSWNTIAGRPAYVSVFQHTEPPDDNLRTGELAIWFDQTAGTSIAKFKAKDENGTVVTADVPLA